MFCSDHAQFFMSQLAREAMILLYYRYKLLRKCLKLHWHIMQMETTKLKDNFDNQININVFVSLIKSKICLEKQKAYNLRLLICITPIRRRPSKFTQRK